MSDTRIPELWLNILKNKDYQLSFREITSDNILDMYVIYVDNISRNNNKKYVFKLKEIHINPHTLVLQRIFPERNFTDRTWKYDVKNTTNTGIISVKTFIHNFGVENLKNVLLPKYYEEMYRIFYQKEDKTEHSYYGKQEYDYPYDYDYDYDKGYVSDLELINMAIDNKMTNPVKEIKMKENSKIDRVVNKNTDAAKVAAKISAGKALNSVVINKLKPQMPMLMRGYADHALAPVVVANIVAVAVDMMAKDNVKAQYASEAMLQAAMTDFLSQFNIEKLLSEVLTAAAVEVPDETA